LLATAATPAYFTAEITAGRATARTATRHNLLVSLFVAAMATAVEGRQPRSVVGCDRGHHDHHRVPGRTNAAPARSGSGVEVRVICSTGIALALLGTLILNYAAPTTGAPAWTWPSSPPWRTGWTSR